MVRRAESTDEQAAIEPAQDFPEPELRTAPVSLVAGLDCGPPIPGVEAIIGPGRAVLLGEIHGTSEIPRFVGACPESKGRRRSRDTSVRRAVGRTIGSAVGHPLSTAPREVRAPTARSCTTISAARSAPSGGVDLLVDWLGDTTGGQRRQRCREHGADHRSRARHLACQGDGSRKYSTGHALACRSTLFATGCSRPGRCSCGGQRWSRVVTRDLDRLSRRRAPKAPVHERDDDWIVGSVWKPTGWELDIEQSPAGGECRIVVGKIVLELRLPGGSRSGDTGAGLVIEWVSPTPRKAVAQLAYEKVPKQPRHRIATRRFIDKHRLNLRPGDVLWSELVSEHEE